MFSSSILLLTLLGVTVRGADLYPTAPTGDVYKSGSQCHIAWKGSDAAGNWKSMTIQLMTGENKNMIPLTTVATNQDGTATSTFDHVCPEVTINAPIYFYQFTAVGATSPIWTTRFTIASKDGKTTAAPNVVQPDGSPVPWGVGAIVATAPSSSAAASLPSGVQPTNVAPTPILGPNTSAASVSASAGPTGSATSSDTSAGAVTASGIQASVTGESSAGPTPTVGTDPSAASGSAAAAAPTGGATNPETSAGAVSDSATPTSATVAESAAPTSAAGDAGCPCAAAPTPSSAKHTGHKNGHKNHGKENRTVTVTVTVDGASPTGASSSASAESEAASATPSVLASPMKLRMVTVSTRSDVTSNGTTVPKKKNAGSSSVILESRIVASFMTILAVVVAFQ